MEFTIELAQRYEGDVTRARAVIKGAETDVRLVVHELGGMGCERARVGGVYDPDEARAAGGSAVGDVSARAKVPVRSTARGTTNDFVIRDLPLMGRRSVVGRTLAVWRGGDDGHTGGTTPLACGRIEANGDEGVVNAQATLGTALSRISGVVTMMQAADDPTADTWVTVQLVNRAQADAAPERFRWGIYSGSVGVGSSCSKVGAVFNPFDKDLCAADVDRDDVLAESCPVGQLSARQSEVFSQKILQFTDGNLPLSGDVSVVGKSFVVLEQNGDEFVKILCSDISLAKGSTGNSRIMVAKVSTLAQFGMLTVLLLSFLAALRYYSNAKGTQRGNFARVNEDFDDIPLTTASPFTLGDDTVGFVSKASSLFRGISSKQNAHTHSS